MSKYNRGALYFEAEAQVILAKFLILESFRVRTYVHVNVLVSCACALRTTLLRMLLLLLLVAA